MDSPGSGASVRTGSKPPPLPSQRKTRPTNVETAETFEPQPPPLSSTPSPIVPVPAEASEVLIHDFRPHWTHRIFRYVQSSAGFGTSLVVHVVLILILAIAVFHEQIAAPLIAITARSGEAETEVLVAEPFELKVEEPEIEHQAMDDGGLEDFADLGEISPEPLGEISGIGASTLDSELNDSLLDAFGGGKFAGEGGLFDDSFDGMIEYARSNGLDIVIAFDSTGSMGNEIANIKSRIMTIGGNLIKKVPSARISLVTYRDIGDEYEAKGIPLSSELRSSMTFLNLVRAGGGGDYPEAVDKGLEWAIKSNKFRARARKVVLVFGDAPPHSDGLAKCITLADEFYRYEKGIVTMITVRNGESLPEFIEIAKAGGGSAFGLQDTQLLMEELLVQVFGEKHRKEALKFFGAMEERR
jgi:hypothetical protein